VFTISSPFRFHFNQAIQNDQGYSFHVLCLYLLGGEGVLLLASPPFHVFSSSAQLSIKVFDISSIEHHFHGTPLSWNTTFIEHGPMVTHRLEDQTRNWKEFATYKARVESTRKAHIIPPTDSSKAFADPPF
jgi:hypothetical protein